MKPPLVITRIAARRGHEARIAHKRRFSGAIRLVSLSFVGFIVGALPSFSVMGSDQTEPVLGTKVSPAAKSFGRSKPIDAKGMLRWAASISLRPVPDGVKPPALIPTDEKTLAAIVCPNDPEACSSVAAAYSIETREIRYRASFDLRNIVHRSYIVHEMVHFLQHLDQRLNVTKTCHQILRNEREAYGVQAAYLRRHGSVHASQIFPRMAACQPTGDGETSIE